MTSRACRASRAGAALAVATTILAAAACGGAAPAGAPRSGSGGAPAAKAPSAQQVFPQGLTLVVGYGSGGAVDTAARVLQPLLHQALGVPVVVQNMPGAGGRTAARYVFSRKPNAPDLLMAFLPALTIGQVIGGGRYSMGKLTPIYGVFGGDTIVVIARRGSPLTSFAALKTSGRQITAGVAGVKSTAGWAAMAELAEINHINMVPVPFKGGAAAADAALGGSVDLAAVTVVVATRLLKAGRAQALVEFGAHPYGSLPGVPSIARVGRATEVLSSVMGVVGPPHMPPSEVRVLSRAFGQVVRKAQLAKSDRRLGMATAAQPPATWQRTLQTSYRNILAEKAFLDKFTAS